MLTTQKKGVMAVVTPVNRSQQTECKVICKSHLQLSLLDGLSFHICLSIVLPLSLLVDLEQIGCCSNALWGPEHTLI